MGVKRPNTLVRLHDGRLGENKEDGGLHEGRLVENKEDGGLHEERLGKNKEDGGLMFVFWKLHRRTLENKSELQRVRID